MKKKIVVSIAIFALLLISVVFANSYVQALSKEERLQLNKQILEQKLENNEITEEQANQIYENMQERITYCDNLCQQNENCPIYQQNGDCIQQNNQCIQKNDNYIRNCGRGQNHHNRMCNR